MSITANTVSFRSPFDAAKNGVVATFGTAGWAAPYWPPDRITAGSAGVATWLSDNWVILDDGVMSPQDSYANLSAPPDYLFRSLTTDWPVTITNTDALYWIGVGGAYRTTANDGNLRVRFTKEVYQFVIEATLGTMADTPAGTASSSRLSMTFLDVHGSPLGPAINSDSWPTGSLGGVSGYKFVTTCWGFQWQHSGAGAYNPYWQSIDRLVMYNDDTPPATTTPDILRLRQSPRSNPTRVGQNPILRARQKFV